MLTLATTGFVDIAVAYDVRDIDGSADDAIQRVAVQYRVGTAGDFTNLPSGFVADATTGGTATQVTPVAVDLPAAADDQPVVQVRVITADAAGSDEWVGIDNIAVTGTPGGGGPAEPVASCPATLITVAGTAATAAVSATDADSDHRIDRHHLAGGQRDHRWRRREPARRRSTSPRPRPPAPTP